MGGKPMEINPTTRLRVSSPQVIVIERDDLDAKAGKVISINLHWMDALEMGAKLIAFGMAQLRRHKR